MSSLFCSPRFILDFLPLFKTDKSAELECLTKILYTLYEKVSRLYTTVSNELLFLIVIWLQKYFHKTLQWLFLWHHLREWRVPRSRTLASHPLCNNVQSSPSSLRSRYHIFQINIDTSAQGQVIFKLFRANGAMLSDLSKSGSKLGWSASRRYS